MKENMKPDMMEEEQEVEEPEGEQPEQPDNPLQDSYNRFTTAALQILYTKEVTDNVVKILENAPKPSIGLSNAVLFIVDAVREKSKGKVPEKILIQSSMELLAAVGEMAEQSGAIQEVDEQSLGFAATRTIIGLAKRYNVSVEDLAKVFGLQKQPQGQPQVQPQPQQQPQGMNPQQPMQPNMIQRGMRSGVTG